MALSFQMELERLVISEVLRSPILSGVAGVNALTVHLPHDSPRK
jgi:hypothetical protein